jgi:hypothetical protein
LPDPVKDLARDSFIRFQQNPAHPGLHFKAIPPSKTIHSVRIGLNYRALGVMPDSSQIVWFWIGSHADYDKLI